MRSDGSMVETAAAAAARQWRAVQAVCAKMR
jgi:hypothetical protein